MTWLRWKIWALVTRSQRVCPANARGAIIEGIQPLTGIFVDSTCRKDAAACGTCFCGNPALTRPGLEAAMIRPGRERGK